MGKNGRAATRAATIDQQYAAGRDPRSWHKGGNLLEHKQKIFSNIPDVWPIGRASRPVLFGLHGPYGLCPQGQAVHRGGRLHGVPRGVRRHENGPRHGRCDAGPWCGYSRRKSNAGSIATAGPKNCRATNSGRMYDRDLWAMGYPEMQIGGAHGDPRQMLALGAPGISNVRKRYRVQLLVTKWSTVQSRASKRSNSQWTTPARRANPPSDGSVGSSVPRFDGSRPTRCG